MLPMYLVIPAIYDHQEHIHFMKHAAAVIEGKIDQVCAELLDIVLMTDSSSISVVECEARCQR